MDLKLNEEGTDFIDGEGDIYQDIETALFTELYFGDIAATQLKLLSQERKQEGNEKKIQNIIKLGLDKFVQENILSDLSISVEKNIIEINATYNQKSIKTITFTPKNYVTTN